MKLLFTFILFSVSVFCYSQENYSITINEQNFDVELEKSFTYITEGGDSVEFVLHKSGETSLIAQNDKNNAPQSANTQQYQDSFLRFTYPENYAIAITQPADDFQQITMINGNGGGIIIQEFTAMNPSSLKEFFLNQLATAQNMETASVESNIGGKQLRGIQGIDGDGMSIKIYSHSTGNQGVLLALLGTEEDDLLQQVLSSLQFK